MCRWLAYSGSPIRVEDLLYKPEHSLIVQSLHSQMGAETTNGDGFGIGWYGVGETPGVFRSVEPAWNDRNLLDLSRHLDSSRFFAHIRASTGSPVQLTNCHPFRHGRWLWMHNGFVNAYATVKRELALAVAPERYSAIEGTTDSEILFFLALTFGLEEDPPTAVARTVGFVEDVAARHDIPSAIQMTIATTDGATTWAFRYATDDEPRSLYHSTDVTTLRHQYPDNAALHELSDDSRLVVSEPLGSLRGAWREVPPASCLVVHGGDEQLLAFEPIRSGTVV